MSAMKELFAAAREDAPPDLVRDRVWGHVAAHTMGASPAPTKPTSGPSLAAAKAGSLKLVALGAILGGAVVAALVLPQPRARGPQASASVVVGRAPGAAGEAAARAEPAPRVAEPTIELDAVAASPAVSTAAPATPAAAKASVRHEEHPSGLAEEARLVTEARAALVRGDAAHALALVKSTRELPVRMLEPEELVVEARALRALGRSDEALAAELRLKRSFPEHALSR